MYVRATDRVARLHGVRWVGPGEPATLRSTLEGAVFVLRCGALDHIAPTHAFTEVSATFYRSTFWESAFAPAGHRRALGYTATAEAEMRGSVYLLRKEPGPWSVPAAERRAAGAMVGHAFRAAWEAELAIGVPEGTLIVDAQGAVRGDPAAEAWLERAEAADYVRGVAARATAGGAGAGLLGPSDRAWAPAGFLRAQPLPEGGAVIALEPALPGEFPDVLVRLTPAQLNVASLAAAGATNNEIAAALGVGAETVRSHLSAVYEKLGVASRAELASRIRSAFV